MGEWKIYDFHFHLYINTKKATPPPFKIFGNEYLNKKREKFFRFVKRTKELNINKTHISKTLKELLSKKIIICLTPKANKGKLYVVSNYGKEILKEILKIN